MKKIDVFYIILIVSLWSCNRIPKNKVINVVGNDFLSINFDEAKKLKAENLPLSELVESFNFIRLENSEKAFVGSELWGSKSFGDYLDVRSYNIEAVRLFTKTGKFLAKMGAIGQGPGEYSAVYSSYIDSTTRTEYIAPYNARYILAYDFSGKYLPQKSIPLAGNAVVPKCRFWIDFKKKEVVIVALPFKIENPQSPIDKLCWVQDFRGDILKSISAKGHELLPDYSNEIIDNPVSGNISFSIYDWNHTRPDTLFHFDTKKNQLEPRLTVNFGTRKNMDMPRTFLQETEGSYWAYIGDEESTNYTVLRILKKDHSVKRISRFVMDDLYLSFQSINFQNGYITLTYHPYSLIEKLDDILKRKDLNDLIRKKVMKLRNSLHEDDNDVVFMGKLKKDI